MNTINKDKDQIDQLNLKLQLCQQKLKIEQDHDISLNEKFEYKTINETNFNYEKKEINTINEITIQPNNQNSTTENINDSTNTQNNILKDDLELNSISSINTKNKQSVESNIHDVCIKSINNNTLNIENSTNIEEQSTLILNPQNEINDTTETNSPNNQPAEIKHTQNEDLNKIFGKPHKLKIREAEIDIYINTIATQSNTSILLNYKGLSLFFSLDVAKEIEDGGVGFAQFVVHFITKSYAFSKIPTGPTRRENKMTERDILLSRLIDRSIRPLINKNFQLASQLICTLLSYPVHSSSNNPEDNYHLDLEFLAVLGACITIHLSSVPLIGIPLPCKVILKNNPSTNNDDQDKIENQFICFPYISECVKNDMELFLSFNNEELIMIECEAKELTKENIIEAVSIGRKNIKNISVFLKALSSIYQKQKIICSDLDWKCIEIIEKEYSDKIKELLNIGYKPTRNQEFINLFDNLLTDFQKKYPEYSVEIIQESFFNLKKKIMHEKVFSTGKRIDGRTPDEIRNIDLTIDLPFMESSHGSSLFIRGETRALVSVVLGTIYDEQVVEGFENDKKERFILHYNFLPYATGEAYQLKNTNRREIGHGKLAFKAIRNVLPEKKQFPYTLRVCSEIMSCDGSSSMATICASSIGLMDAGVPIKSCVAGIAIGVVVKSRADNDILILTDIIGDEDHLGDMDFKIAGTKKGITALQMDVKEFGIKDDQTLMRILNAGCIGYNNILEQMIQTINSHRTNIKKNAPCIVQMVVEKNYIKSIIGNRGETIKTICEVSGAKVDVDSNSCTINIFGPNRKSVEKAKEIIDDLILQPEVGKAYDGIIDKITDFGIFVRFLNDKVRGLIHERNCDGDRYDFYNKKKNLKIGEKLKVKVLFISADGKVGLSIIDDENILNKELNTETAENTKSSLAEKINNDNNETSNTQIAIKNLHNKSNNKNTNNELNIIEEKLPIINNNTVEQEENLIYIKIDDNQKTNNKKLFQFF